VIRIPDAIPEELAESDDQKLKEWASAWDEAVGCSAHGAAPDLVAALVRGMAALAREAEATGRVMYVWLCESL
jgi:hypothetical protein